jgi:hypothetical protein
MSIILFEPNCNPQSRRVTSPERDIGKGFLKPRESLYGEWFEKFEDSVEVYPRSKWDDMAVALEEAKASAYYRVWMALDQANKGSCSQEEACGATMVARSFTNQPTVALNPWPNYYLITRGRGGGTSIDSAWKTARDDGYIPMETIARNKGFRKQSQEHWDLAQNYRLDEVYDIGSVDEAVSALLQGFCVGYGRRGHAILAVRYLGRNKMTYLNSWGQWTNCNDPGFGQETIRDFGNYGMFAARTAYWADSKVESVASTTI